MLLPEAEQTVVQINSDLILGRMPQVRVHDQHIHFLDSCMAVHVLHGKP